METLVPLHSLERDEFEIAGVGRFELIERRGKKGDDAEVLGFRTCDQGADGLAGCDIDHKGSGIAWSREGFIAIVCDDQDALSSGSKLRFAILTLSHAGPEM